MTPGEVLIIVIPMASAAIAVTLFGVFMSNRDERNSKKLSIEECRHNNSTKLLSDRIFSVETALAKIKPRIDMIQIDFSNLSSRIVDLSDKLHTLIPEMFMTDGRSKIDWGLVSEHFSNLAHKNTLNRRINTLQHHVDQQNKQNRQERADALTEFRRSIERFVKDTVVDNLLDNSEKISADLITERIGKSLEYNINQKITDIVTNMVADKVDWNAFKKLEEEVNNIDEVVRTGCPMSYANIRNIRRNHA